MLWKAFFIVYMLIFQYLSLSLINSFYVFLCVFFNKIVFIREIGSIRGVRRMGSPWPPIMQELLLRSSKIFRFFENNYIVTICANVYIFQCRQTQCQKQLTEHLTCFVIKNSCRGGEHVAAGHSPKSWSKPTEAHTVKQSIHCLGLFARLFVLPTKLNSLSLMITSIVYVKKTSVSLNICSLNIVSAQDGKNI